MRKLEAIVAKIRTVYSQRDRTIIKMQADIKIRYGDKNLNTVDDSY